MPLGRDPTARAFCGISSIRKWRGVLNHTHRYRGVALCHQHLFDNELVASFANTPNLL
jgi:hypothetical protein